MKKKTRNLYKSFRNSVSDTERKCYNKYIMTQFINSELINYELYLIYVSFGTEVDTKNLIEFLLNSNKRVAVPLCNENGMIFFEIHSLSELIKGKFGIMSVDEKRTDNITDFSNALCVVPGVCFDRYGNRIGYGGGYYDRFLSANPIDSVGLCFERCIKSEINAEKHDINVKYILTESYLKKALSKEASVYE